MQQPMIVSRHKYLPHGSLHLSPSSNQFITKSLSGTLLIFPPLKCIMSKFQCSQLNLFSLRVVMTIEDHLHTLLPFQVSLRVTFPHERWYAYLDVAKIIIYLLSPMPPMAYPFLDSKCFLHSFLEIISKTVIFKLLSWSSTASSTSTLTSMKFLPQICPNS